MKFKDFLPKNIVSRVKALLLSGEVGGSFLGGKGFKPIAMVYAEGVFHLFYINECLPLWSKALYHDVSYDMINWEKSGTVNKKLLPPLMTVEPGSATLRNGKIELLYGSRTPLYSGVKLATSRNKMDFSVLPISPLSLSSLIKKKLPLSLKLFGAGHPRLYMFEDSFGVMTSGAFGKYNEFHMFRSPNLIDWDYNFSFMREPMADKTVYACPSPVKLGIKQILIYSAKKRFGAEEACYYRECAIRLGERCVTPLAYPVELPSVYTPRTVPIPDGRVVLLSALRDGELAALAIPKEMKWSEGKLLITPIREVLSLRRREDRFNLDGSLSLTPCAPCEYLITLGEGQSYNASFDYGDGNEVYLQIRDKTVTLSGKIARHTCAFDFNVSTMVRIIARKGAVEVFIENGVVALGIPTANALPQAVHMSMSRGDGCSLTQFLLELN